jgi:hypothetical protein
MINDDYFIFTFCAFFPLFISNTSIVSINFGANLDAQNAGKDISGIQKFSKIQTFSGGVLPQTSPSHSCVVYWSHVAFSHCYPPSNILSHRKVPFQKMPPPRENP